LAIADMDRNYYAGHQLTIARHPSETDERMMVRVLAFALFADESLALGRGLSVDDEPDLWARDLTGAVDCWIDVGQPEEKWIRKACSRAGHVVVISYGRAAEVWWSGIRNKLTRLRNLTVLNLPADTAPALAALTDRSMRLQCTIQDGQVWMTNGRDTVVVEPLALMEPQLQR
jgi:uncharacterized protein YaeQ